MPAPAVHDDDHDDEQYRDDDRARQPEEAASPSLHVGALSQTRVESGGHRLGTLPRGHFQGADCAVSARR